MKKLFTFAALSILTVGAMYAQEHSMRIHFNDGTSTLIKATDVAKITFESGETPQPGSDKMVDMGLSVKWAAWNVGGTKPSDYGNFYAYGETEPKTEYTIDNYKWLWEDWNDDPTLYEEWEHYLKLGATIAGTNYDVAHVKWGDQWRMPTREEWILAYKNEVVSKDVAISEILDSIDGVAYGTASQGVFAKSQLNEGKKNVGFRLVADIVDGDDSRVEPYTATIGKRIVTTGNLWMVRKSYSCSVCGQRLYERRSKVTRSQVPPCSR